MRLVLQPICKGVYIYNIQSCLGYVGLVWVSLGRLGYVSLGLGWIRMLV